MNNESRPDSAISQQAIGAMQQARLGWCVVDVVVFVVFISNIEYSVSGFGYLELVPGHGPSWSFSSRHAGTQAFTSQWLRPLLLDRCPITAPLGTAVTLLSLPDNSSKSSEGFSKHPRSTAFHRPG